MLGGVFDSFIDGEVKTALNQAMPRLFMARVMQQYLAEIPEKGAATPENVQERLKSIIDAVAKDTNTPWGDKGQWLGDLWTEIVDEKVAAGKPEQLTAFINDPRFEKLFAENQALFNQVISPDIMGPKGQKTRLELAEKKATLEGILGTVDAIAAESGLLTKDETLSASIDSKIQSGTVTPPLDLDGYNVSPEANKSCMEQFVALMSSLFEGIFGESKDQAVTTPEPTPTQTTPEQETGIVIPPEALEALKGVDLNNDGRFDGNEITGENLDKVLGAIRANLDNRVMLPDLKDFNGDGTLTADDVVSGLNKLVQQAQAAKQRGS